MKRAIVVILLFAACHGAEESETKPVVSVRVAKASIEPIAQPIDVVGTIAARQEATISPKISAQIAQMPLLKNRAVHRGEVLAVLESRDLAAQRNEAEAAVTTARDAVGPAEGALENARRTYERRKALYEKGGISKKDLEASQLDVVNAEGGEAAAKSRVTEAVDHLAALDAQSGYSTIRAPFDGVITEQFQYQGDFATAGAKLLTIVDASNLIVKAPLSAEAAARVHAGDAATVQPDDLPGVSLAGRVELVGQSADPQSRAVELWIPLRDPRLRANSAARVTIASAGVANAVVVPTSAVMLDAANANSGTVMVVDAQSIAHEVHVMIGAHTRDRTQIASGLRGGESVVIEGNYGLPDGTKVSVAKDVAGASWDSGQQTADSRQQTIAPAVRCPLSAVRTTPRNRATAKPQAGGAA